MQCEQELRKRISATRGGLVEMLKFELQRTPDPKNWAEQDMPFRVRRETAAFGRQLEDFLVAALARDFAWLQERVRRGFGAQLAQAAAPPLGGDGTPAAPSLPQLELTDTHRLRFLSRVGSGAATIAGYLVVGPLASAAAVAWGLASEPFIDKKVQAQRELLLRELTRSVDRFLDEYAERVAERLRHFYRRLMDDTRREQSAWLAARVAALEAGADGRPAGADEAKWREAVAEASALRDEVAAALRA